MEEIKIPPNTVVSILQMWSISQEEKHQVCLLLLNVPCAERDFMGVVAPDVTEKRKIGPKTRADDIKCEEFDRNNKGKSAD